MRILVDPTSNIRSSQRSANCAKPVKSAVARSFLPAVIANVKPLRVQFPTQAGCKIFRSSSTKQAAIIKLGLRRAMLLEAF